MNRNINLINRALEDAGQEPITEEGKQENIAAWRTVKEFYLPVMLEMLSSAEWTKHKKRTKLELYEGDNYSKYRNAYVIPIDCAKPCQVQDNEEYIVEGNLLYTDVDGAILLYITNHHRNPVESLPTEDNHDGDRYLCQGVYYEWSEELNDWKVIEEDYPEYDNFELAPEEEKYFENALAAQIVLKITGDKQLYQLLYSIAMTVKDEAIKQSRSQGVSTEKGNEYWGDKLGITTDGVFSL